MSFEKYVDSLAKQGMIDGNIADMLVSKHRDEYQNPYGEVRKNLSCILDEMWQSESNKVKEYADMIDDVLTDME